LSSRLSLKSKISKIQNYNFISGLYGCNTWSFTLREEYGSRAFENRALRRIFGPKREEVRVGWKKLHNEELHNFDSL
jgi:hypothetical protein